MDANRAAQRIGVFVSPHGFGHAARTCAVLEAVHSILPSVQFDIFTLVPRWFFEQSLTGEFGYQSLLTDIGLVQTTPLRADLPGTIRQLDSFLRFDDPGLETVAERISRAGYQLLLCDISPLGISLAARAGVPSLLLENFTWDWIYEGYLGEEPAFARLIPRIRELFSGATYHIQAEPVCAVRDGVDLTVSPISRRHRTSRHTVRSELGVSSSDRLAVITMGGIPATHGFLEALHSVPDVVFLVPGGAESVERRGNLLLIPHHSDFYHPDLMHTCDIVIGKLGYSTVAEAFSEGAPFGYVRREGFRESDVLASFVDREMSGIPFTEDEFDSGLWIRRLPFLITHPRIDRHEENGADQVAEFVAKLL